VLIAQAQTKGEQKKT